MGGRVSSVARSVSDLEGSTCEIFVLVSAFAILTKLAVFYLIRTESHEKRQLPVVDFGSVEYIHALLLYMVKSQNYYKLLSAGQSEEPTMIKKKKDE